MQVSVIVATYNRRELLARTLPALLTQQFPVEEYEVIVVIDGSTDGTSQFLCSLSGYNNLHVIEQANRGQAAAINAGLSVASGELVLFLDDDIQCSATLVAEHARAQRRGNCCLVFGPVMVSSDEVDPLAAEWTRFSCDRFFESVAEKSPEQGWYGCMASANSSAPRSVILSVGGMDESFSRGNDVDLGFRLRRAGFSFSYLPSAVTYQIVQKTSRDVIEDARGDGIAGIHLCRKYPELRATSRFGKLSSRPLWERLIVRFVATSPLSLELLLRPWIRVLKKLWHIPMCRRWAMHLLLTQHGIAAYRSAAKEVGSWKQLKWEFGKRLPILMYHCIGPLRERFDPWLTISPQMFERHLRWLARHGFTTIHVSEWIAYQREGKTLPDRPVLLTFDDAYQDTAEFGLPLLKKYGFTGTVFVVTDQIGGTNAWDLHLGLCEMPLMNADQIRYWAQSGIEFGAHTRTHADLRTSTAEQIVEEMKGSRECLERLLGVPVTALAYPYGYYNDAVSEAARMCFDVALTCDPGMNNLLTDMVRLRRANVYPRYTWFDMRSSVLFGFNLLATARIHLGRFARRVIERLSRLSSSWLR